MNIAKKTILITGGSSGIGLALAQAFAKEGAKIIVTGRKMEKLQKVKQDNPAFEIIQSDVAEDTQVSALVQEVEANHGGIDVLVNNAGVFQQFDVKKGDHDIGKQIAEMNINVNGPLRTITAFLPMLMKRKEAAIMNVSSGLAYVPLSISPVYCATKAALHSYTQSLRKQLESTNVAVFELMPPLVDTPMVDQWKDFKKMSPEKLAEVTISGFKRNKYEIRAGQAKGMYMMSRYAPGFIFKQINKQFS